MQTITKPALFSHASALRPTHRSAGWIAWLELCLARYRERRLLQELGDHQLKDIGLSRADAERECRRWPWDGPTRNF